VRATVGGEQRRDDAQPRGAEQVAQFVLRITSVRWDIPEFMISGDASNQNLNSATLAYESFVKSREADQGFYASHFEALAWKVLRMRWEQKTFGTLSWQVLCRAVGLKATLPDVAGLSKDSEKVARENETLNRMGIKSKRTIAAELNLDYDEEQRNIAKEPKTQEPAPDMGQNTKYAAMVGAIEAELDRDGVRALVESFREEKTTGLAIKNLRESPQSEVTVNIPAQVPPVVTVNVPQQPPQTITVNVPEQLAPVVNYTAPEQQAPIVNVQVDVPPAQEFDIEPVRNDDGRVTKYKRIPKSK
jgi:hypothetical protein